MGSILTAECWIIDRNINAVESMAPAASPGPSVSALTLRTRRQVSDSVKSVFTVSSASANETKHQSEEASLNILFHR